MNRLFLLLLLLCCQQHFVYAGGTDTLEVRNAYHLAISLNKAFDEDGRLVTGLSDLNKSNLLNALYYYAARIDTTESLDQISTRLNQDPVLGKMALLLTDSSKRRSVFQLLLDMSDSVKNRQLLQHVDWSKYGIVPFNGNLGTVDNTITSYIKRSDSLKSFIRLATEVRNQLPAMHLAGDSLDRGFYALVPAGFDTISFSSRNFPEQQVIDSWLNALRHLKDFPSQPERLIAALPDTNNVYTRLSRKLDEISKWNIDLQQDQQLFRIVKDGTHLSDIDRERDNIIAIRKQIESAEKNASIVINTLPAQYTRPLSMSMPSETEMIDALAIYLVKRVKQETVMWFFENLKKRMHADTLVNQLLPNTVQLLSSNEVYEVPSFGTTWQYALSKDLVKLPETLFQSDWLKGKVKGLDTTYGPYLNAGVKIADLINQRMSINDVITQMHLYYLTYANEATRRQSRYIASAAHLLYGISQECYVIKKDTFNTMISYQNIAGMDDRTFRIMLELINLRYGSVFSNLNVNINDIRDIIPYKQWLANLLIDFNQLQKVKVSVDQKEEDKAKFSNYNVWTMLQTFLVHLPPPMPANHKDSLNLARFHKGIYLLGRSQNIFSAVQQKNYYGMVEECISIIDTLIGDRLPDAGTLLREFITEGNYNRIFPAAEQRLFYKVRFMEPGFLSRRQGLIIYAYDTLAANPDSFRVTRFTLKAFKNDKADSLISYTSRFDLSNLSDSALHRSMGDSILLYYFPRNNRILMNPATVLSGYAQNRYYIQAIRYLKEISSFLADVAASKGSAELSTVIEKYALPPASYKRKRNVWHSLDINAFVGPYIGLEKVQKTDISNNRTYKGLKSVWGLSAPIGVTYTKTFSVGMNLQQDPENISMNRIRRSKYRFRRMSGLTMSLTASIIDIGAVVSYRFQSSDSTLPQQVKWSQFVSPGLHLNVAIPSTPLCFMVGGQYNPELRRFVNEDRQYGAFRFYCGIYFDLPLYNLSYKQ